MAQYIVKKGDNLSTIAKRNGLKLNDIIKSNNIPNPDLIQVGQKINLPVKGENKVILKNTSNKSYTEFLTDQLKIDKKENPNTWKGTVLPNTGKPRMDNFDKQTSVPVKAQLKKTTKKSSIIDDFTDKISEIYGDVKTGLDQQFSKKTVTKPKIEIVKTKNPDIEYGYKELGTYKDQSFKAGKNDSLLSAMNTFDNEKGFDYITSPKVKEGIKTFNNVKGVAHFIMDGDITEGQKFTSSYKSKDGVIDSNVPGKFINYTAKNPEDYVMYYKNGQEGKVNVKYGQLKDKDKFKGYENIKVRSIPFSSLDFNRKKDAGFAKKASYIGTNDGSSTSLITDPDSNDVYGRFSGGSGIFLFKEPKTGKEVAVDISGSVNTIKQVGEDLAKKYNIDKKDLQFLYHDMGSYSAKPKSHNGQLSNSQWENYNTNNKGYSGAALMYPMEFGGLVDQYPSGGKIDLSNTVGDRKVFNLDEFKNIVPDYQYQGYLNSGKDGLYKNIDKSKFPVQVDTLPDGSITYRPYSYESAETSYEDYKKLSQNNQPMNVTPIKIYENGGYAMFGMGGGQGGGQQGGGGMDFMGMFSGMMGGGNKQQSAPQGNMQALQLTPQQKQELELQKKAEQNQIMQAKQFEQQQAQMNYGNSLENYQDNSVQKYFWKGGKIIAEGGYSQTEFNPYGSTYQPNYNWQQYPVNQQIANPYQNMNQNMNMKMDMNQGGANIQANTKSAEGVMGGQKQQSSGDGGMGGAMNYAGLVDSAGTGLNQLGQASRPDEPDDRNQAWQSAKEKAAASNEYAAFFHGIDEGLQGIGKMAGGNKGQRGVQFFTDPIGFFAAMMKKAGGEEEELKKSRDYTEYLNRNMRPMTTSRGNAKNGINIKQSLINEIHSDFDKFLNK
jgi:LysM repeat protein